MELDYLFLAAHPDDAELYCGGSIIKFRENGYRVGILDFTRGEAATSGTVEDRDRETLTSNAILQPDVRHNLGLVDSGLRDDGNTRILVVNYIRKYRVKVLIAPHGPCRHPDHTAVSTLAKNVFFFSGAGKFPSDHEPWQPLQLIYHMEFQDVRPSFVVDISEQFERKIKTIEAYSTQFYTDSNQNEKTLIGSHRFRELMISRFKYYGNLINCDYGEPYILDETLRIDDPLKNKLEG